MHLCLPNSLPPASVTLFMDDASFKRALEKRVGKRVQEPQRGKRREHVQMGFGPIVGKKGQTHTAVQTPMQFFKPQKFISVDTASPPGSGTQITGMFVGNMNQFTSAPGGSGISSMMFGPSVVGSAVPFDPAQPGI